MRSPLLLCALLVLHSVLAAPSVDTVNTWTWFSTPVEPRQSWPEFSDPTVMGKPNVGISLSGGGTRAFTCALGELRGLLDLGLMKDFRYIVGVSGGAWATTIYTFFQPGTAGVAKTEEELLGDLLPPEQCTLENLTRMGPTCARKMSNHHLAAGLFKDVFDGLDVPGAWEHQIGKMVLEPFGIDPSKSFTWNETTLNDILARNKGKFSTTDFVLARGTERNPFPILIGALLGPADLAPFETTRRRYTVWEATPMYVGVDWVRNHTYYSYTGRSTNVLVGGLLEPFAFGGAAPAHGASRSGSTIDVPSPPLGRANLNTAVSISSYFAGGGLAGLPFKRTDKLGIIHKSWPSVSMGPPVTSDMVYADGGCVTNPNLISLLRRNVTSIIAFFNMQQPLVPREQWDPRERAPNKTDVDNDLSSYFGVALDNSTFGYDTHRNQIFAKADFAQVAVDLQDAQATGRGAVASSTHVTVQNDFWNVEAGQIVNVTWVYLSRASEWEASLPDEIRKIVAVSENPSITPGPSAGDFQNFPHFSTFEQLHIPAAPANLLASLTGWVVKQNAELFRRAIRP